MAYSDRLSIFYYEEIEDELGDIIRTAKEQIVPCRVGRLTHNQQMGMFGTYRLDAMRFHLQGNYHDIEEVRYLDGARRKVQGVVQHPNSTVVFV